MRLTNDIGRLDPRALQIAHRFIACSDDERDVLERILDGIEKGREVYGPMQLADDPRDLEAEADDEARDWLIYRSMRAVQRDRRAAAQEGTRRG
jgi:hypothetical protein